MQPLANVHVIPNQAGGVPPGCQAYAYLSTHFVDIPSRQIVPAGLKRIDQAAALSPDRPYLVMLDVEGEFRNPKLANRDPETMVAHFKLTQRVLDRDPLYARPAWYGLPTAANAFEDFTSEEWAFVLQRTRALMPACYILSTFSDDESTTKMAKVMKRSHAMSGERPIFVTLMPHYVDTGGPLPFQKFGLLLDSAKTYGAQGIVLWGNSPLLSSADWYVYAGIAVEEFGGI